MAAISAITVGQLIQSIKKEARVGGTDDLDSTILDLLNELLLAHSETERYSQFIKTGVAITVVAAQGRYALPVDFQHLRTVYFWHQSQPAESRTLAASNDFVDRNPSGYSPRFYEIAGNFLTLWPSERLVTTDSLTIDYWAIPDALVAEAIFPVAKLLPVIKREVIARIHTFNKDYNGADRFSGSASTQDQRGRSVGDNAPSN